jgi:uncharacterized protein
MTAQADILPIIQGVGGDRLDLPFWEGCRRGEFLVHRCGVCNRAYWPASRCVLHGAEAMAWVRASGRGRVHTYTIMHHAYTPDMRGKTPYNVSVVQLEEGPFFHTNVVHCANEALRVGLEVEALFVEHESGLTMPMFRPHPTLSSARTKEAE